MHNTGLNQNWKPRTDLEELLGPDAEWCQGRTHYTGLLSVYQSMSTSQSTQMIPIPLMGTMYKQRGEMVVMPTMTALSVTSSMISSPSILCRVCVRFTGVSITKMCLSAKLSRTKMWSTLPKWKPSRIYCTKSPGLNVYLVLVALTTENERQQNLSTGRDGIHLPVSEAKLPRPLNNAVLERTRILVGFAIVLLVG